MCSLLVEGKSASFLQGPNPLTQEGEEGPSYMLPPASPQKDTERYISGIDFKA